MEEGGEERWQEGVKEGEEDSMKHEENQEKQDEEVGTEDRQGKQEDEEGLEETDSTAASPDKAESDASRADTTSELVGASNDEDPAKRAESNSSATMPEGAAGYGAAGGSFESVQPESGAQADAHEPAVSHEAGSEASEESWKLAELRGVIGMGVDEQALTELLAAAGGDVQVALECFFEEEKCTNSLARNKSSRRAATGLRRPFEDMAALLGNGVEADLLAPILVQTNGDIEAAVEKYFERKEEFFAQKDQRDAARRARMDQYYRRPEGTGEPVFCNIYDLNFSGKDGKKKKNPNSGLPGVGFGIYHSGIEVYGKEIAFGYAPGGVSGVFEVPPRCAPAVMANLSFKEQVPLGTVFRSRFEVDHVLQRLAAKYRGDTYDIVRKNCNHFSTELAQYLTATKIPSYVNRPANVGRGVLNMFAVPALAVGKLMEGIRKVNRVKEAKSLGAPEPASPASPASRLGPFHPQHLQRPRC